MNSNACYRRIFARIVRENERNVPNLIDHGMCLVGCALADPIMGMSMDVGDDVAARCAACRPQLAKASLVEEYVSAAKGARVNVVVVRCSYDRVVRRSSMAEEKGTALACKASTRS